MSASINLHGPFAAGARLIDPVHYVKDPFVSLDISTNGASVALISIDSDSLEALSAAVGEARVLLASITEPPFVSAGEAEDDTPEPEDGEAQRIAEVYADAKAELDRGL